MPVEKIKLTLDKDQVIEGLKCGEGAIPCIIVGPGSFYFGKLSEELKKEMTFYAFDEEWSCNKGEFIDEKVINNLDLNQLIIKVKNTVAALKEQFSYQKVGLMGFSAPGLIALEAATVIGPKSIAFVIGSGLASSQLDPEFKSSNQYFAAYAGSERKNRFEGDSENFKALQQGDEGAQPLPDSNFVEEISQETNEKRRRLTPTSNYAELVRYLATKQVYDYEDHKTVEQLIAEWKFNPIKKVMSEPMRQHYFTNILSQIKPQELVEHLLDTNIPFMSVYGEYDYTTPPPDEINLKRWQQSNRFFSRKYEKSVHYPSWEIGSQTNFDQDVKNFFAQHGIVAANISLGIASNNDNPCGNRSHLFSHSFI
jgi:pimeloyl-ACP methyl ester carboxylesterase